MRKIVIAIDSFKGSLNSLAIGEAVATGIRRVFPNVEIVVRPLADGGEGTVEALTLGMKGTLAAKQVHGPLGEVVSCLYGLLSDGKSALLEMSGAAGLMLVPTEKRNPAKTSTRGVGELIAMLMDAGRREFIIGIGGSATNDAGAGMLQALGFQLLDRHGQQIASGCDGLGTLSEIRLDHQNPLLAQCHFKVACDVDNPLCGPRGCSAIFAQQKGATPQQIPIMDEAIGHFAQLTKEAIPTAAPDYPGSGAAGGMGFALRTFLNAELMPGVKLVLDATHLEDDIATADIVVTGEGCLDAQTAMGKAPSGVAKLAKKYHKPVIAFAGCISPGALQCHDAGIDAFFPILRTPISLADAMNPQRTAQNAADTAEEVFRLCNILKH